MDTKNKKKRQIIYGQPNRMIVIGIYENPEKGILIARKEDGTIQLPGGKIWRANRHAQTEKQLAAEYSKITRIVFEKCGLSLDVDDVMDFYNIQDPITKKFKLYKVFILAQNSVPADRAWKRADQFDGEFMPADLDQILEYYPNLSAPDKHILIKYFNEYPQQAAADSGREYPKLVKTIA